MTENKDYIIVFYNGDWAEEIDVGGYWYTDKKTYESWVKNLDDVDYPYVLYIGTNQEIEYENKNAILYDLRVKEITKEQYEALKAIHCSSWYGDFPDPEPRVNED